MKKIIITALLLASVLSLSACSKAPDELPSELVSVNYEDNETSSNLQSSVSSESITSSQESDTHEKDLFSNITVTTKPIIVCQWTDTEKRLFANKFKEKYGIPENIPTGYEELSKSSEPIIWTFMDNDTISVKALSDSAPDLCIIDGGYGLFMNKRIKETTDMKYDTMFKKIDELIDFSKSEWDDFRPFINYQKENGGIYLAPTETYLNGLCYIKSDITDNNLENPYELYSNSEWTWDKFYDVCEKYAEKNDSAIGFYTAYTTGRIYPFLSLTDVNFVDYKNKKFISNINHPDVIKTLEFIFKLGHTDKVTERSNEELSKTALFYNLSDVVRL